MKQLFHQASQVLHERLALPIKSQLVTTPNFQQSPVEALCKVLECFQSVPKTAAQAMKRKPNRITFLFRLRKGALLAQT